MRSEPDPALSIPKQRAMRFVLITVFIYSAGFGIIMPALPDLIRSLSNISLSDATRIGAWIGATYALFQFAMGPLVGNLGDRFGRRPVFLVSLFAYGLDFLLMGMATSIVWLFIGRGIAGGLGAMFGPANAAMADLSDANERAASFGKVGAAFGIGFILGPAIGGILASQAILLNIFATIGLPEFGSYAARHSTRLPFFVAASMAFANFAYGWFAFPETMPKERQRPFEWRRANPLGALLSLGKVRSVLPIAAVCFLWAFASQIYPASWTFFAQAQYGWGTGLVGVSLALSGLSMAFFQAVAIGRLVKRFGERLTAQLAIAFGLAGFLVVAFQTSGVFAMLICLNMGVQGMAMPAMNALMSRRIPPDQQGELQGFNGSLYALAFLLSQLIFNFTLAYFTSDNAPFRFPGAPFIIAAIFAATALLALTLSPRASAIPAAASTALPPTLWPINACSQTEIDSLLDEAFGAERRGRTAYKLRAGTVPVEAMSFCLIEDDDTLAGSIQCWPVKIDGDDGERYAMVLVGPVAVAPRWQGQGLGQILMNAAIHAALLEGNPPLVMIGDPEYYQRFGFFAGETAGWTLPGPWEAHRLLLRNAGDYPLPLSGTIGPDIAQ
jgi:MFS transporter, DHA1 family, tetracycline resistance protein